MRLKELSAALDKQFKLLIESKADEMGSKKNSKEYRVDCFAVSIFVDMTRKLKKNGEFSNKSVIKDKAIIVISPNHEEVKATLIKYFVHMDTLPSSLRRIPSACFLFDKVIINKEQVI